MAATIEERGSRFGVELVAWPGDEELRQRLARAGVPRLLLVGVDDLPPRTLGLDEDWVRLPVADDDLTARMRHLSQAVLRMQDTLPWIDTNRVLHRDGATVVLSSAESVVATALLAEMGTFVGRARLEGLLWPDGAVPSRRAVDTIVYRLRKRLTGMNLCIRTARSRGFALVPGG